MRRAAKRDANERDIITFLEAIPGVTVQPLSERGVPDLLVGVGGVNLLMEVKDGGKPPSARKLTPDQVTWHASWRGQVHVVKNEDEALALVLPYLGGESRENRNPPARAAYPHELTPQSAARGQAMSLDAKRERVLSAIIDAAITRVCGSLDARITDADIRALSREIDEAGGEDPPVTIIEAMTRASDFMTDIGDDLQVPRGLAGQAYAEALLLEEAMCNLAAAFGPSTHEPGAAPEPKPAVRCGCPNCIMGGMPPAPCLRPEPAPSPSDEERAHGLAQAGRAFVQEHYETSHACDLGTAACNEIEARAAAEFAAVREESETPWREIIAECLGTIADLGEDTRATPPMMLREAMLAVIKLKVEAAVTPADARAPSDWRERAMRAATEAYELGVNPAFDADVDIRAITDRILDGGSDE
ncbi:MAG: hypothetical protein V3S01_09555 [Dehalococcoidia bacterium]